MISLVGFSLTVFLLGISAISLSLGAGLLIGVSVVAGVVLHVVCVSAPPTIRPWHGIEAEVMRTCRWAIVMPQAAAELGRALRALNFGALLLTPFVAWAGTWWLAAACLAPWFLFGHVAVWLNPWHYYTKSTDPSAIERLEALHRLRAFIENERHERA